MPASSDETLHAAAEYIRTHVIGARPATVDRVRAECARRLADLRAARNDVLRVLAGMELNMANTAYSAVEQEAGRVGVSGALLHEFVPAYIRGDYNVSDFPSVPLSDHHVFRVPEAALRLVARALRQVITDYITGLQNGHQNLGHAYAFLMAHVFPPRDGMSIAGSRTPALPDLERYVVVFPLHDAVWWQGVTDVILRHLESRKYMRLDDRRHHALESCYGQVSGRAMFNAMRTCVDTPPRQAREKRDDLVLEEAVRCGAVVTLVLMQQLPFIDHKEAVAPRPHDLSEVEAMPIFSTQRLEGLSARTQATLRAYGVAIHDPESYDDVETVPERIDAILDMEYPYALDSETRKALGALEAERQGLFDAHPELLSYMRVDADVAEMLGQPGPPNETQKEAALAYVCRALWTHVDTKPTSGSYLKTRSAPWDPEWWNIAMHAIRSRCDAVGWNDPMLADAMEVCRIMAGAVASR